MTLFRWGVKREREKGGGSERKRGGNRRGKKTGKLKKKGGGQLLLPSLFLLPPMTNPSLPWSHGRDARCGSSFRCERALQAAKPPWILFFLFFSRKIEMEKEVHF